MRLEVFHRLLPCLILLGTLTIGACNTEDDDDDDTPNPCGTPSLNTQTAPGRLEYYLTTQDNHGYYELQYGSSGFSLGSGTVVTVNSYGELQNMNNGTYDIYVRGHCGGDSWSDWAGPQSFLITGGGSGSCGVPYNFDVISYTTSVYIDWYQNTDAGYFQVQYGPTGFAFGTGQTISVPESYADISGLTSGTIYDYYVRANCGGSDFSAWSAVNSFVTN